MVATVLLIEGVLLMFGGYYALGLLCVLGMVLSER